MNTDMSVFMGLSPNNDLKYGGHCAGRTGVLSAICRTETPHCRILKLVTIQDVPS